MNYDDQFKKELVNTYMRFIEASSVIFGKNIDASNVGFYLTEMAFEVEKSIRLKLADIDDAVTSEYLNTTPKKCGATSARFLVYAVESFENGEITDAFINLNEANKAILAAQNFLFWKNVQRHKQKAVKQRTQKITQ